MLKHKFPEPNPKTHYQVSQIHVINEDQLDNTPASNKHHLFSHFLNKTATSKSRLSH